MNQLSKIYHKYRNQLTETFGIGYFHDPISLVLLGSTGLSLLAILLLLIFRLNGGVSQVPIVYDVIYGVTGSGSWVALYGYFLVAVIFGFLNSLLAWILFDKERLLSYLLGIVSLVIYIIFFIFIYNLTMLVR